MECQVPSPPASRHGRIRRVLRRLLAIACALPLAASAAPNLVSSGELQVALEQSLSSGTMPGALLGGKLAELLGRAGWTLDENGLSVRYDSSKGPARECRAGDLGAARARPGPGGQIEINLESLFRPVVGSVEIRGEIDSAGRLLAIHNRDAFGNCERRGPLWKADPASLAVIGMRIVMNPRLLDSGAIRVAPTIQLEGRFDAGDAALSPVRAYVPLWAGLLPRGRLAALLEGALAEAIGDGTEAGRLGTGLQRQLDREQVRLQMELDAVFSEGREQFYLPPLDARQLRLITNIVNSAALGRFPVSMAVIRARAADVRYALLAADRLTLRQAVGGFSACLDSGSARIPARHGELYGLAAGACRMATPLPGGGPYYSDPDCLQALDFEASDYSAFCRQAVADDQDALGNTAAWSGRVTGTETAWSTSPASRFDIGSNSIRQNRQPFVKRVAYRQVEVGRWLPLIESDRYPTPEILQLRLQESGNRLLCAAGLPNCDPDFSNQAEIDRLSRELVYQARGNGLCELSMRIYKRDIGDAGLKPMMALHGGGWLARGFGFYSLESQLSHFTDRGFVVFAPFLRAAGDDAANIECNGASLAQIDADLHAAFDWVLANAHRFGAGQGARLALFGEGGGAHQAAWLATRRPLQAGRVLALAPVSDFADLLDSGATGHEPGAAVLDDLSVLFDRDPAFIDPYEPGVTTHSLVAAASVGPDGLPDIYLLHGLRDGYAPPSQSQRLCNVKAGDRLTGPARLPGGTSANGDWTQRYACGSQSHLALFAQAGRGFGFCATGRDCAAGSTTSRALIRTELRRAMFWLAEMMDPAVLVPVIGHVLF